MSTTASTTPIRKSATVPCTRERAFEMFTKEMSQWWPLTTHSIGEDAACRVDMDGQPGGEIIETLPNGTSVMWGTIELWEPPSRLAFTWHPGHDPAEATRVEVTFEDSADGTRVTLIHDGWSARPDGATARPKYDGGWDLVLGRYAAATNALADQIQ